MIITIFVNLDGITIGIDDGTDLRFLAISSDCYNYWKLESLFLVDSLGHTDVKVLGSDEGIELGFFDDGLIWNILGHLDKITLGDDVKIDLVSSD